MEFDTDDLRNIAFFLNAINRASEEFGVGLGDTTIWMEGDDMGNITMGGQGKYIFKPAMGR